MSEDGMSGAETAAAVIGSLACLGMAVGGGYCLVKYLKMCLPTTPNTPDLEASETPEEVGGPPKNPLKTIKAWLQSKVQEVPMVDPVDPVDPADPTTDQMDPTVTTDPTNTTDPTDTISTASTASYKSILD